MKYEIVNRPPWFLFLWKLKFPLANFKDGVIFVWGKTIYIYKTEWLSNSIRQHEEVHIRQQNNSYLHGLWWLVKYVFSEEFRLQQELEAHKVEYKANPKRLKQISERLASPLYGNIITTKKAKDLIKHEK